MTLRTFVLLTFGLLMTLMLGACETRVRESIPGHWVTIPAGSTLRLNRAIPIPQGRARAFFVGGGARASGASQDASCALEVRRIDHAGIQTVAPGVIRITRVQDYVALVADRRTVPGATGGVRFRLAGHGDSGGSQMIQQGYHFWLDDSRQPNLMRLTCLGRLDDPAYTRPPTIAEIQAALGELATLELPGL
ncbi:MAG: hypothetical protein LJE61_10660 [Thiocapsa sp.]|jgi:hypothetical protein|nr:hypothetical protein [Thiocapsa sp.]MCG6895754.1 hypothetical protein [Thiocapsa sp.]MCG6985641.1 hypothetical protein [Thiocapsa sp.]